MPVYIAVIFILVGPILNPIVFASTFMAFRGEPAMAYSRMGLTFGVALIVGLLLTRFLKSNPLRHPIENAGSLTHHTTTGVQAMDIMLTIIHAAYGHNHDHNHNHEHDHDHHHGHHQSCRNHDDGRTDDNVQPRYHRAVRNE